MPTPAPEPSALPERAAALLRSIGQRATKPRVAVLSRVLAAGDQHLSADDLLAQVTADGVHRATVYRTLDGLTDAGVLCHVHLDRGLTAYHLANEARGLAGAPHLHAQCAHCGKVVDLPPDVLGEAAAQIRKSRGFWLDPTHVALSGTCSECATTAKGRG